MLEDSYFCLIFVGTNGKTQFCGISFFEPDPLPEALSNRKYVTELLPELVCESKVKFDDNRHADNDDPSQNDEGLPARICLHSLTRKLNLSWFIERRINLL